ncbi:hypothetical protein ElyMa_006727500 [Elysia marginata]|uniref:BZIP domain-containing protein n=1 Tax=Elysia marginata TaxID=1093978 RepID=A0AAV4ITF8_9GAST|nr:hypothetical protein ElyMa_006727500 [Elysia marginata]
MVRIISQNFSPQRSRHSSGETDKYLADRARSALGLSVYGKKRFDLPECESSSDSFWDSELDGDHHDAAYSEGGEDNNDINGNETLKKSNVQSKRKERRRERNKISAQAYRQRRRSQNMKEQQELLYLETENKRLHQLVDTLQKKTEQVKQSLRGHSVPMPGLPCPSPDHDTRAACVGAQTTTTTTVDLSHTHSPETTTHSTLNCDKTVPSTTYRSTSPYSQATASTLPVMSNMNLAVSMPNHVLNENFTSGASPSNVQTTVAISPVSHTQILVNANALMKSQVHLPDGAATAPTFAVPTLMAIPVEYNTAATTNINLNSQLQNGNRRPIPPLSAQSSLTMEKCSPPTTGGAPVVGAIMWSLNSNPPPQAAVYSLMNIGMCNNKNIGSNINSNVCKHNMNGCDNSRAGAAPGSPVKVNLNEVKVTGEPLKFWHAH